MQRSIAGTPSRIELPFELSERHVGILKNQALLELASLLLSIVERIAVLTQENFLFMNCDVFDSACSRIVILEELKHAILKIDG